MGVTCLRASIERQVTDLGCTGTFFRATVGDISAIVLVIGPYETSM